jgi:hypothetical protein
VPETVPDPEAKLMVTAALELTMFPKRSSMRTSRAGEIAVPVVTVLGGVESKVSVVAAPEEMTSDWDAEVSPLAVALRV